MTHNIEHEPSEAIKQDNNTADDHKCKMSAPVCYECKTSQCNARGSDYLDKALWNKCTKCNRSFKTQVCFDMHIKNKTCERFENTESSICNDLP